MRQPRTFAIGDIHGCATALKTLLKTVPFGPDDTLVTLGDYVDRGPNSKKVIEQLLLLRSELRLVTLKGNHEIMMLRARQEPQALADWLVCGGQATIKAYGSMRKIPESHWHFLESCLPSYETETHFYVHANALPDYPIKEQPAYALYWERFDTTIPHESGRRMVCGHTPQLSGMPTTVGHAVCIDTHAHANGWLTCLDVEADVYWQANEKGQSRSDVLQEICFPEDE